MEDSPQAPPVAMTPGSAQGGNAYIRCPLPPFNATVDTMRQFNESGKVPTRRVIPLPVQTVTGVPGTSVTNVTDTGSNGGGGGGTGTTLAPASVTVNVPTLGPLQRFTAMVPTAKEYQLIRLSTSTPVEVRLYSNSTSRGGDIARQPDTAVPFEIVSGLMTDVLFDTLPYVWSWQNRVVANADSPQTDNLYITIVNPSATMGISGGTLTIIFLPFVS